MLYNIALNLICQYAVINMNKKKFEMFRIAFDDILRTILTILDGFEALSNESKTQLVIANIPMDLA